jgi:hypothetical protein
MSGIVHYLEIVLTIIVYSDKRVHLFAYSSMALFLRYFKNFNIVVVYLPQNLL